MKNRIKSSLISVILAGLAATALAQSNIYVATNGVDDGAAGRGQSWASPYATISNGIAKAPTAGDTVWVSNGTYVLSTQVSLANAITVSAWSANPADTIIDGGYPTTTNRCVYIPAAATLKGFTISNGVVNNNNGGGVYMWHASSVVTNCVITQNRAVYNGGRGGGIFLNGGKVTDCIISNNTAANSTYGYGGGGLWCESGGSVLNCRFLNNVLNGTNAARGGGLGVYASSTFIVSNCVFDGNTADGGAGLSVASGGGYVRILDCTFSNNVATNGAGGGAFLAVSGTIISNCVIMRNSASGSSAGIYMYGSTGINCEIKENLSRGYDSAGTTITGGRLENSSILNNTNLTGSGGSAGGVFMRDYSLLRNCLIVGNVATGSYCVGGVYYHTTGGRDATMQNCTVAFNSGTGVGGIGGGNATNNINCIIYHNAGSYANWQTDGYNFLATNLCITPTNSKLLGAGNITNAPQFVDTNSANYRLAKGSPCINTGLNDDWMTNGVDRDGRMRRRYGTVDIGAYEAIYNAFIFRAY